MNYEIRSINTRYENDEIKNVQVSFNAKTETRDVNVNGHFTMTAEEYNQDSSIPTLEQKAKEHIESALNN